MGEEDAIGGGGVILLAVVCGEDDYCGESGAAEDLLQEATGVV